LRFGEHGAQFCDADDAAFSWQVDIRCGFCYLTPLAPRRLLNLIAQAFENAPDSGFLLLRENEQGAGSWRNGMLPLLLKLLGDTRHNIVTFHY